VLAAFGASAAFSAVEAVQQAVLLGAPSLPIDPKLLAAAAAGWLIGFVGAALAFLAIMGLLWLLVQLGLSATIGAASGFVAVVLGVLLFVAVTVGATYVMWTFLNMGVDPSAVGGLDRILMWEASKASAPGLVWGLVFALRGGRRRAVAEPVGAG
jgi:hypothetical protein